MGRRDNKWRFPIRKLWRLLGVLGFLAALHAPTKPLNAQAHTGHGPGPGVPSSMPSPSTTGAPASPAKDMSHPAAPLPRGLGSGIPSGSTSVGGAQGVEKPPPGWPSPVNDAFMNSFVLFDLFEFQLGQNVNAARWDILGWWGSDTQRIWLKSEGRYNGQPRTGEGDLQILYGHLISPFMDFQTGFRWEQQLSWDNKLGRASGVVGVQGLVPFGMELEAAVFVSTNADVSARLTVTQDFPLTQRLILQARFEINAAVQSVPQYGVGSGVNDIEPGLRLRYEIMREVAPYVGVSWLKSFGETADLRAQGGDNPSALQFVAGVRLWF